MNVVNGKDIPVFSSLIGISTFHMLNLTTIIFAFYLYVLEEHSIYPKWVHIIIMGCILLLDYYIYVYKKKYISIIEIGSKQNKKTAKRKDIAIIIYIVFTLISFFWILLKMRSFYL